MNDSLSTGAPAQPAVAKQPLVQGGLWTTIAVVFSIVAVWLFAAAVAGSIALLSNTTPSFDSLLSLLVANMSSFAGVTIAAFGSVIAAGVAFFVFNKLNKTGTALSNTPVRVGAAVTGIEAVLLFIAAIGTALFPLLTIREGMNAGAVYLVEFLPLMIASIAFAGLSYFFFKLLSKPATTLLSAIVLITAAVALVLGILAVVIKSHDDGYTGGSSSSSTRLEASDSSNKSTKSDSGSSSSGSDKKVDSGAGTKSSGGSGTETTATCVEKYSNDEYDFDEYLACYKKATGGSSSSSSGSSRSVYDY